MTTANGNGSASDTLHILLPDLVELKTPSGQVLARVDIEETAEALDNLYREHWEDVKKQREAIEAVKRQNEEITRQNAETKGNTPLLPVPAPPLLYDFYRKVQAWFQEVHGSRLTLGQANSVYQMVEQNFAKKNKSHDDTMSGILGLPASTTSTPAS